MLDDFFDGIEINENENKNSTDKTEKNTSEHINQLRGTFIVAFYFKIYILRLKMRKQTTKRDRRLS